MKQALRTLFFICMLVAGSGLKAQTLGGLSDSVFEAMRYANFDSLKKFTPTYSQLKATIDSMDIDKEGYQIMLAQKQVEFSLKRSFKSFIKEADALDIPLAKMEKEEMRHLIQNDEGKRYSIVEIDCRYRNRGGTILFTAVELNGNWYLGEDIRIREREIEAEPDYEKIDRAAEKRREKRQKAREEARQKAIADSAKAAKNERLETEKAARDSAKAAKKQRMEEEREAKEIARQKRAEEKARQKALREEEKQRKKEERERKKKEKELRKKPPPNTAPKDTIPPSPPPPEK